MFCTILGTVFGASVGTSLNHLATFAVLGFVGVRLFGGLRRSLASDGRALVASIVRGIRWRHVWPVPFVLTAVIFVATALVRLPVLKWGWWTALGGQGNPVFGTNDATGGTIWEWLVPVLFMAMLIPALPLFALAEERLFRRGAEHWSGRRRALKIVQFGLIHAVIGIPIGVALALSIGGAYFMFTYLRSYRNQASQQQATMESTRAHATYNGLIVTLIITAVVLDTVLNG